MFCGGFLLFFDPSLGLNQEYEVKDVTIIISPNGGDTAVALYFQFLDTFGLI